MKKTSQLSNLYRRLRITISILIVYMLGCTIPVPFAQVTKQFSQLISGTPVNMISFMSGANFQHISLFMVGLNPLMIAMLFMQLLMMTRLFGFDTLSINQITIVQQVLTLTLAIVQSSTVTIGFHIAKNLWENVAVIIILTTGSMFVVWLGFMNMKFGIGGTVTIIMFNIITMSIPNLTKAVKSLMKLSHPYLWVGALIIMAIGLMVFWLAFSRAYYPLKTINISLPSYAKAITVPLGLNMGAMMTYMVGMALLMLPMMLSHILGSKSIFADPAVDAGISGIMSFFLFYFFCFVQFNPREQAKKMRNENTYIPNIRPGKPTQKFLNRLMWTICFPGALLNSLQIVFGLMGNSFMGKYAGLTVVPMYIVMIVMIMSGIKDEFLTLLFPQKYSHFSEKEGKGWII